MIFDGLIETWVDCFRPRMEIGKSGGEDFLEIGKEMKGRRLELGEESEFLVHAWKN